MPDKQEEAEQPPWRRLFHEQREEAQQGQQEQEQQQQQVQPAEEEQPLTELQQQLLICYRKTFLVAGCGLAGSVWRWNTITKHKQEIFLPPRAQALPEAVVQRWKQKAAFREGLRTVGRQTLLITGVAGLYFGTELGVGLWREQQGDWANTAAAGALAGGLLGSRVPSSMRGRTMAVGCVAGGMMGALSGWTQQQLSAWAAEQQASEQQQQQQPPPAGRQQQ